MSDLTDAERGQLLRERDTARAERDATRETIERLDADFRFWHQACEEAWTKRDAAWAEGSDLRAQLARAEVVVEAARGWRDSLHSPDDRDVHDAADLRLLDAIHACDLPTCGSNLSDGRRCYLPLGHQSACGVLIVPDDGQGLDLPHKKVWVQETPPDDPIPNYDPIPVPHYDDVVALAGRVERLAKQFGVEITRESDNAFERAKGLDERVSKLETKREMDGANWRLAELEAWRREHCDALGAATRLTRIENMVAVNGAQANQEHLDVAARLTALEAAPLRGWDSAQMARLDLIENALAELTGETAGRLCAVESQVGRIKRALRHLAELDGCSAGEIDAILDGTTPGGTT